MIDLSRRNFLIGFGAAALATRIPLIAQAETVSTAQSLGAFDYRAINDVMINFDLAPTAADRLAIIELMKNDRVLLNYGMNTRQTMRWVPVVGEELIFLKGEELRFTCNPGYADLQCSIIYETERPGSEYTNPYAEMFAWKDGQIASQWIDNLYPEKKLRIDPNAPPYEEHDYDDDYEMDDDDARKIYG